MTMWVVWREVRLFQRMHWCELFRGPVPEGALECNRRVCKIDEMIKENHDPRRFFANGHCDPHHKIEAPPNKNTKQ